jgi:hypothetical protein
LDANRHICFGHFPKSGLVKKRYEKRGKNEIIRRKLNLDAKHVNESSVVEMFLQWREDAQDMSYCICFSGDLIIEKKGEML